MSYETADEDDALQSRPRRRLVRKAGYLPFVPWGLVPAAGLGLLFLIALGPLAGSVELATETSVEQSLAAQGLDWAKTSVSGQWVTIEGEPSSAQEARKAEHYAREALASTPFGMAHPATRVNVPQGPYKARPGESDAPLPPIQDVTEEAAGTPDWRFTVANGVMRLEGGMPDQVTKDKVVRLAFNKIYPPRVVGVEDALDVVGQDPPPIGYIQMAMRGVNTVTRCDTGTATFEGGRFSLRCELPGADASEVREQAIASTPFGTVDTIDILPHEAVETCESKLDDLLKDARIEFDSSSAVIDPSSNGLLDEVAAAVKDCPGTLRIEGHSDVTGSDEENRTLSANRALAVRNALIARMVNPNRLIAEGYGATRPIAVNTTPEGRARNRRIEIRVVRASE
ncbi:MAG TPA: OmpA family protein [Hyphomonas sp.]|nr:OmpA family protein [Hyphomonas sp.]